MPTATRPAETVARDRDWILDPDKWLNWPVLTMIRLADNECGVMWAGTPRNATVYLANIFLLGGGTFEQVLGNRPKVDYPDLDALLAEWRVD